MSDRAKILGYGVDTYNFEQALDYACSHAGQVVTINPEMIECALTNPELSSIINNAELVVADGIGVEIGLKILGYNIKRIAGIELGKALIEKFANSNRPIAMIGAKHDVINKAIENLQSEIPGANIVYSHDGYFENTEDILNQVCQIHPELVLVALGSPKQEIFINNLKEKLPNALMIGVGGSFDVWSGVVKRAPVFYQKTGLEWLYRTMKEPKRFKRIFPTLPLFMLKVFIERLEKNAVRN